MTILAIRRRDPKEITLANLKKDYGATIEMSLQDTDAYVQEKPPSWTPPQWPQVRSLGIGWGANRVGGDVGFFQLLKLGERTGTRILDHEGFQLRKKI